MQLKLLVVEIKKIMIDERTLEVCGEKVVLDREMIEGLDDSVHSVNVILA